MKIIFWNTARGSNLKSDRFQLMMQNVLALSYRNPELILLCEGLKGTKKEMRKTGGVPGYKLIKPDRTHGSYCSDEVLRYVLISRNDVDCKAYLFDTPSQRPAIIIRANGYNFLGIHAPSVTQSYVPQSKAVNLAMVKDFPPYLIFGDLNVDIFNASLGPKFISEVQNEYNRMYRAYPLAPMNLVPIFDPNHYTRPKSQKSLDWALVPQMYSGNVSVSVVPHYNEEASESEYEEEVISTTKSDHEAIQITIV